MVMIDITVPSLDMTYDFTVSDTVPVRVLIDELTEIICQKEKLSDGMAAGLALYDPMLAAALAPDRTLADYGIDTGRRLLLM